MAESLPSHQFDQSRFTELMGSFNELLVDPIEDNNETKRSYAEDIFSSSEDITISSDEEVEITKEPPSINTSLPTGELERALNRFPTERKRNTKDTAPRSFRRLGLGIFLGRDNFALEHQHDKDIPNLESIVHCSDIMSVGASITSTKSKMSEESGASTPPETASGHRKKTDSAGTSETNALESPRRGRRSENRPPNGKSLVALLGDTKRLGSTAEHTRHSSESPSPRRGIASPMPKKSKSISVLDTREIDSTIHVLETTRHSSVTAPSPRRPKPHTHVLIKSKSVSAIDVGGVVGSPRKRNELEITRHASIMSNSPRRRGIWDQKSKSTPKLEMEPLVDSTMRQRPENVQHLSPSPRQGRIRGRFQLEKSKSVGAIDVDRSEHKPLRKILPHHSATSPRRAVPIPQLVWSKSALEIGVKPFDNAPDLPRSPRQRRIARSQLKKSQSVGAIIVDRSEHESLPKQTSLHSAESPRQRGVVPVPQLVWGKSTLEVEVKPFDNAPDLPKSPRQRRGRARSQLKKSKSVEAANAGRTEPEPLPKLTSQHSATSPRQRRGVPVLRKSKSVTAIGMEQTAYKAQNEIHRARRLSSSPRGRNTLLNGDRWDLSTALDDLKPPRHILTSPKRRGRKPCRDSSKDKPFIDTDQSGGSPKDRSNRGLASSRSSATSLKDRKGETPSLVNLEAGDAGSLQRSRVGPTSASHGGAVPKDRCNNHGPPSVASDGRQRSRSPNTARSPLPRRGRKSDHLTSKATFSPTASLERRKEEHMHPDESPSRQEIKRSREPRESISLPSLDVISADSLKHEMGATGRRNAVQSQKRSISVVETGRECGTVGAGDLSARSGNHGRTRSQSRAQLYDHIAKSPAKRHETPRRLRKDRSKSNVEETATPGTVSPQAKSMRRALLSPGTRGSRASRRQLQMKIDNDSGLTKALRASFSSEDSLHTSDSTPSPKRRSRSRRGAEMSKLAKSKEGTVREDDSVEVVQRRKERRAESMRNLEVDEGAKPLSPCTGTRGGSLNPIPKDEKATRSSWHPGISSPKSTWQEIVSVLFDVPDFDVSETLVPPIEPTNSEQSPVEGWNHPSPVGSNPRLHHDGKDDTMIAASHKEQRGAPAKAATGRKSGPQEMMKHMESVKSFFGSAKGELGHAYHSSSKRNLGVALSPRQGAEPDPVDKDGKLRKLRRKSMKNLLQRKVQSCRDLSTSHAL